MTGFAAAKQATMAGAICCVWLTQASTSHGDRPLVSFSA